MKPALGRPGGRRDAEELDRRRGGPTERGQSGSPIRKTAVFWLILATWSCSTAGPPVPAVLHARPIGPCRCGLNRLQVTVSASPSWSTACRDRKSPASTGGPGGLVLRVDLRDLLGKRPVDSADRRVSLRRRGGHWRRPRLATRPAACRSFARWFLAGGVATARLLRPAATADDGRRARTAASRRRRRRHPPRAVVGWLQRLGVSRNKPAHRTARRPTGPISVKRTNLHARRRTWPSVRTFCRPPKIRVSPGILSSGPDDATFQHAGGRDHSGILPNGLSASCLSMQMTPASIRPQPRIVPTDGVRKPGRGARRLVHGVATSRHRHQG